jgi:hypothetical protein
VTRRPRRQPVQTFFANLSAGDYNPLERVRRIGGNLLRRDWLRHTRRGCCGNYGDPGC